MGIVIDPDPEPSTFTSSSFWILYPDIPVRALSYSDGGYANGLPVPNRLESAFYGEEYNRPGKGSAYFPTSYSIVFDLGTDRSSSANYLLLHGISMFVGNSESLSSAILAGSNDNSSYTNILGCTAGTFSTRSYAGTDNDTVLFTPVLNTNVTSPPDPIPSYRYFRLTLTFNASPSWLPSKIYLGTAFDMGKEPDFYDMEVSTEGNADTWVYPRGHTIMSKAFYPRHRATIEWDGVSDAKATEFFEKILSDPYNKTFFLYTQTYLDPLYDNEVLHCRINSEQSYIEKDNERADWNKVYAVFEEVV